MHPGIPVDIIKMAILTYLNESHRDEHSATHASRCGTARQGFLITRFPELHLPALLAEQPPWETLQADAWILFPKSFTCLGLSEFIDMQSLRKPCEGANFCPVEQPAVYSADGEGLVSDADDGAGAMHIHRLAPPERLVTRHDDLLIHG